MRFSYTQKCFNSIVHKVVTAPTMNVQVNKTRRDVISFGVYFIRIRKIQIALLQGYNFSIFN
ncbi:hypothetical protein D3C87_2191170 [compost metagenome]